MEWASTNGSVAPVHPVIESSRRARERAAQTRLDIAATRERVHDARRRALAASTVAADGGAAIDSVMADRQKRLSGQLGRSPLIEDAKARLAEQYGISRAEAFRLLITLSNGSNRKLRGIAAELVRA